MYKIIFECDLFGSHTAPITELCEVDSILISDQLIALKFIQECTSCITRENEICPWIAQNQDIFTENRPIAEPFSKIKDKNVHLIPNKSDFKTLI
tara:strand:+ start:16785 stop:17069 length:285 start_codon:yes stop_codon:yes gene_type:complete